MDRPSDSAATGSTFKSYAYNTNLDSKNESQMNNSAVIILNYEVTATALPQVGTSNGTGSTRHLEGSNFSFVDGHVKWYRPEKTSTTATTGIPTFSVF